MRTCPYFAIAAATARVACATPPPQDAPQIKPAWALPEGVKAMAVNGYPMAYVEQGSGVPIVLVQGAWVDYRRFAASRGTLAAQHRVIAASFRHHYPEPWDGKGDGDHVSQHVADLALFLKKLNAGQVHLVGHSRGGTAAMMLASRRPNPGRSQVLAEGGGDVAALDTTAPSKPGFLPSALRPC